MKEIFPMSLMVIDTLEFKDLSRDSSIALPPSASLGFSTYVYLEPFSCTPEKPLLSLVEMDLDLSSFLGYRSLKSS